MALSSYCRVCGLPQDVSDFANPWCSKCETRGNEARQAAKAEQPELSEDQLLYVARQARQQGAHTPHATFINPRNFSRGDVERR